MAHFDALAAGYDSTFTQSPIARALRARTHARLMAHMRAGMHLLELGCGTGEDALYMAQQGLFITATDASAAMCAIAQTKTTASGRVEVQQLDMAALPAEFALGVQYDGAFANFGALNCLAEWRTLAAWLAVRLRSGALFAAALMPPVCLWEMAWHGLHVDWQTATRRWNKQGARFKASPSQRIYYPTPRRFANAMLPYFHVQRVMPLGLLLPPSDVYGVLEQRPRLLRRLMQADSHLSAAWLAPFADHYWIELRRS